MKQRLFVLFVLAGFLGGCKKVTEAVDAATAHNRPVGASAPDLLTASRYKSLKVEVQYMPGFAPDAAALDQLKVFLEAQLHKPGGISLFTREIAAAANGNLSADDVRTVETANRTAFNGGDQLAVYVLYTNGAYTESNVLGIAYRNTSVALFGKRIRENSGGVGQVSRTKLEATVLQHELGHLLGLVDLGTAAQTPHKANGNHCNNQNCLMHYASETTDVLGFLLTGNVPALDAACTNDLRAAGGK